jgi:hypothetical protein
VALLVFYTAVHVLQHAIDKARVLRINSLDFWQLDSLEELGSRSRRSVVLAKHMSHDVPSELHNTGKPSTSWKWQ